MRVHKISTRPAISPATPGIPEVQHFHLLQGVRGIRNETTYSQPVLRQHKQDFPKFDGKSDPLTFIHGCEAFFHGYRIFEEKVWMASIHLLDAAQIWYMHMEADHGTPTWNRFTELLNLRFGPPLRANLLGDQAACKRTGTVADYCEQFLSLLARAGKLSQSQQVQLFTVGIHGRPATPIEY
jgi:hypothetical protein